ncbi:MAG: FtsW/RodA/SpoVE family cell cycle protein [Tannerellaceae bacterium]
MDLANKLFKGDRVIWIIFMFLGLTSIIEVFSATSTIAYRNSYFWGPIVRHTTFLLIGFACVLVLHNIPYKFFRALVAILPLSLFLIMAAMIFGESVNGASRWLTIFGVSFQPSEIAKISLIGYVAFILSKRTDDEHDKTFYWLIGGILVTCAFILIDNFSTAFMLFVVCFLMMFIGMVPIKQLLKFGGSLAALGALALLLLMVLPENAVAVLPRAVTWKNRIESFTEKHETSPTGEVKITDENFQVSHAKIAIARGGVFGQMPGHGQQRDYLPQAYSDFIFAIIMEELGLLGGFTVLSLYVFILIRVGLIARKCETRFPKLLVLGCGLLLVLQALTNMSVAVNLIPVTGQPLPLVSRGGTSTIITCVYFGIILSVSRFAAGIGDEEDETEEEPQETELSPVLDTVEQQTTVENEKI